MAAIIVPVRGEDPHPLWQNLSLSRGDDAVLDVAIAGDVAVAGWTLSFWAATTWAGPALVTSDGAAVDPATRKASLAVGKAQTDSLVPGTTYVWEVRRTDPTGLTAAVAIGIIDVPGGRP